MLLVETKEQNTVDMTDRSRAMERHISNPYKILEKLLNLPKISIGFFDDPRQNIARSTSYIPVHPHPTLYFYLLVRLLEYKFRMNESRISLSFDSDQQSSIEHKGSIRFVVNSSSLSLIVSHDIDTQSFKVSFVDCSVRG